MLYLLVLSAFSLSSCYIETLKTDNDKKKETPDWYVDNCPTAKYQTELGCLEINLPASPDLEVASKQFRDAVDLGQNLAQLIQIQDATAVDDPVTPEKEVYSFTIEAVNAITNQNWAKDFKLNIKGPKGISASSNFSQGFSVHSLPESAEYQARVEKEIMIEVTKKAVKKNADGSETELKLAEPKSRYCAVLYKDFAFEILGTKKKFIRFDKFDIYKPQTTCKASVSGDTVINK